MGQHSQNLTTIPFAWQATRVSEPVRACGSPLIRC